jgi:hypothetical protein
MLVSDFGDVFCFLWPLEMLVPEILAGGFRKFWPVLRMMALG